MVEVGDAGRITSIDSSFRRVVGGDKGDACIRGGLPIDLEPGMDCWSVKRNSLSGVMVSFLAD